MKRAMLLISFSVLLFACNNNSTADSSSDSADHSGHNNMVEEKAKGNNMTQMHDAMNNMMDEMKSFKPSGNADHDFAVLMKIHHKSAVDMAKIMVDEATDPIVKAHAQNTISEQQAEIEVFDKFLDANKSLTGKSDYGQKAMQMMTHMNSSEMNGSSLTAMYASMMIPHHKVGVKMAEEYLKVGANNELRKVAQSIIQSQPKEIKDYQQWLDNANKK